MAGRSLYTGEEVLLLLDEDGEDGGLDDTFFPGSNEELGFDDDEWQAILYMAIGSFLTLTCTFTQFRL